MRPGALEAELEAEKEKVEAEKEKVEAEKEKVRALMGAGAPIEAPQARVHAPWRHAARRGGPGAGCSPASPPGGRTGPEGPFRASWRGEEPPQEARKRP